MIKPFVHVDSLVSPRDLAMAVGVSASSVKRWADDGLIRVARTAGGHRRIELAEAVRFIRQSGLPVVRPERLGLQGLRDLPQGADDTEAGEPFRQALLDGSAEVARAVLVSQYLSGAGVAQLCDGMIAGSMHHIGELWKHEQTGIVIEHRATDVCVQALNHLRALLPVAEEAAPVALGGAPSGDPYVLPSLAASATLAADGWRDINLGPQTPPQELARAADHWNARLVWLSVSVGEAMEQNGTALQRLVVELGERGIDLVIGGRAVTPRLGSLGRNVHVAGSMAELAAYARGLRSASGASSSQ